jgi:hypothetical protein
MFKVVLETTEVLYCYGFGLDHRSNTKGRNLSYVRTFLNGTNLNRMQNLYDVISVTVVLLYYAGTKTGDEKLAIVSD